MLPPGDVELRSEQSFGAPTWWRVIASLAATFAPATKSDKGTREKLETQDHSRGARNFGGWRNAGYSGGSAERSGWSRRRRGFFCAFPGKPGRPTGAARLPARA